MSSAKKSTFPDLSENERTFLDAVAKGNLPLVQQLIKEKDVKVECLDESGMTPLQHAAFRGKTDVAEYLMKFGANVNSNYHEQGYTTLMFAALSGSADMTRLVLQWGAKKDKVNSVGRNAGQMAAFVGQHHCVAVINNYFDKADLEYYTITRGQETEPKLPPQVLPALLKLLNSTNMHPIKISMYIQTYPELVTESYKVCKVLDLLSEKAMRSRDTDDVMAMKAHYFATIIKKAKEYKNLESWIKMLVKGREEDGYPEMQDRLIRQMLKEFPFVDSMLLQNMVRQLSATKIGDSPTSLNILNQGVNGQKFGFDKEEECAVCGQPGSEKKCTACKMVHYCRPLCQKLHWATHKKFCKQLAEEYKVLEAAKVKQAEAAEEAARQEEEAKSAGGDTKITTGEIANGNTDSSGSDMTANGDHVTDSSSGDSSNVIDRLKNTKLSEEQQSKQ